MALEMKQKKRLSIFFGSSHNADFAYKNHACDKVLENKQVPGIFSNDLSREALQNRIDRSLTAKTIKRAFG